MDASRPHQVALLVLPTVIPLELGTVTEVFGRDPNYDLTVFQGQVASVEAAGYEQVAGGYGLALLRKR